MIIEKYNKLKNIALIKSLYLSGTTFVIFGLCLLFIFVVKVIPLVVMLGIVALINWGVASTKFHNRFMSLQQEILELSFKEKLKGFKVEIGGKYKENILKELEIFHYETSELPSFITTTKRNDVKVYSYSTQYKNDVNGPYIYGRVYKFTFKKTPYALNLEMFDSPVVLCSTLTEVKYTDNDIYLHFASESNNKNNIYSLFLNKYRDIEEYLNRLEMEINFIDELIDVAKND